MPIPSTLAARLGTGASPANPRWSPYARSSVSERRGGAQASRPPVRFDPATARLLGPAQKALPLGLDRRAEPAASDASSAAHARRRRGSEMTSPKPEPKPKPKPAAGDHPRALEEKRRCSSGGGGFVFLRALAGHTEAISGISLPLGSDKLYSGSADGSVRIWDCNSGKGLRTIFGMHRVGNTPVLICSHHSSNCIRLLDLPSFDEVGTLFSKKEVRTIELADGGPLFTGDCSGELKVWRWTPQDAASDAHLDSQSPV